MGRGMSQGVRFALALLMAVPAAAVILAGGQVAVAQAQGVVIRDIRVEGNQRVEPETVRSYLKFAPGDRYDPYLVDQSLKALFQTGLFSDVRIQRSGRIVIVRVVENPVVNRVAFEGNREVDDKTLRAEVQLKTRSVFTRARVQADVQRILDVYRRQGRFAAQVEPKIIELSHNRVNLVFEITEGVSTKVKSINFIGNRAFSDSQLRDVITTGETGWLSFLKSNDIYDPDRLNLDRELLRQFYLKNGYADSRIVSAVADLDRDGQGFFITFTIEEGELYTFGDIRVETNLSSIDTAALEADLLTKPGEVYNALYVDKSIEKLTLAVASQGYAFARVRPRADRDPIARTVSITYVIEQGPRVYIERINIYGNTRTLDYVIRREFRLAEGDAYNRLLVERARKRLLALGFFKKVTVTRAPGSAPDRIILNVNVVEQATGELSFGAGYSTAEGVIGDISISERNLMGKGQFLRLKLGGSTRRFQIDLSFTEPRFLDRNLSAGFDVFHKQVDLASQSSFRSRKTGGGLRLGFPIAERTWMTTRYTFVVDQVYDVSPGASLAVAQAAGTSTVSSVGYTIAYDTRNHRRNPTRGYYATFSQDFAGLGGDVQYIRTVAEARAYFPLYEKVILVARLLGGYIEGWGGDDVRLIDLFYKGGETVRGFDRAGIGPRDAVTGDALGGKLFYAGTLEVRFPLPLIPEELGMGGAVFVDAGSLSNNPKSVAGVTVLDSDAIRATAGVSLLWASPVGPLRADYAFILASEDYDRERRFRFGASTKF